MQLLSAAHGEVGPWSALEFEAVPDWETRGDSSGARCINECCRKAVRGSAHLGMRTAGGRCLAKQDGDGQNPGVFAAGDYPSSASQRPYPGV